MTALEIARKNVTGFKIDSVDSAIKLFLEEKKLKSENTAKNYKIHIEEFLMYCLGKTSNIKWEEILSITYNDVLLFRNHLLNNKQLSPRSINSKMGALRTFYKHLYKINKDIDLDVMNIDPLPEGKKEDRAWGTLTEDEVQKLYKFCEKEYYKPVTKRMFFETAIVTALRKEALLSMTWDDIQQKQDKSGAMVWTICVRDKGGKYDYNPITDEFYNRLLQVKQENDVNDNKVFQINEKTLVKTLKDFCKANNIDDDRRITLHSLKSASGAIVYKATGGDIVATSKHLHHSQINTTYQHYVGKFTNLTLKPSYSVFGKQVSIKDLEKYSKEELLEAIAKSGTSTIREILSHLKRD